MHPQFDDEQIGIMSLVLLVLLILAVLNFDRWFDACK